MTSNTDSAGQYFDKETNLHYNYFRDYDPAIGGFIQPEPLGLAGDINLYRYARSNPLSVIDPDGRQPTAPNQNPAAACGYYDKVCQASGGKCFYHCKTAPIICRNPYLIPTLWGVPQAKINCIRICLIEEDKKAQSNSANMTKDCPPCLRDDVINNYHDTCYSKCGVGTWRYPGVGPLGNQ